MLRVSVKYLEALMFVIVFLWVKADFVNSGCSIPLIVLQYVLGGN